MSSTLALAKELINRASVTPDDAGCQALLGARLEQLGFSVQQLNFGEVRNLWATLGESSPLLVFAGHTDVVPAGDAAQWSHPPFAATEADGYLWGRGAADMKGSLAAMVTATESFLAQYKPTGSIGFLITSDEEGPAVDGTSKALEALRAAGVTIDHCLVGEPSSQEQLGDVIKIGRRGSLNGLLRINGVQGHVAYPELASNPIHLSIAPLQQLLAIEWDQGNAAFPPTSLQISNIRAGTGATNVIPGSIELDFNLRYSTETSHEEIREKVEAILSETGVDYTLDWNLSGEPFLTTSEELSAAVSESVHAVTGLTPSLSTGGGTSDGRFIAKTGAQVVELGPLNATIHKVDERVSIADLDSLSAIYAGVLQRLLL